MKYWTTCYDPVSVGDVVFCREIHVSNHGTDEYRCSLRPSRKNMSGEPVLRGWCGETNNVNETATGAAVVIRRSTRDESRVMVESLPADDPRVVALCDEHGITEKGGAQ